MIAQWDNSLSVLPVGWVMIAQWDHSLSVFPVTRVMIAQWDNSLSVLPVTRVMIAQWDNSLSVFPRGPGSIPSHGAVFQGIFPWLIALFQPVLSHRGRKWLNLPSMIPHNLWTARRKAEVQPRTDDG